MQYGNAAPFTSPAAGRRQPQDFFKYASTGLHGQVRHVPLFQEHWVDKHGGSAVFYAYALSSIRTVQSSWQALRV